MSTHKPPRFVMLLNRAQRAVQRWIEGQPDAWEGISPAQVGMLFLLASRGDAAVGEIAQELGVAPAAVTNLSKRMQDAGLIERASDERDGRMTRLRMTQAGVEANALARPVLARLNAELAEGFTQQELATVGRWLENVGRLGEKRGTVP